MLIPIHSSLSQSLTILEAFAKINNQQDFSGERVRVKPLQRRGNTTVASVHDNHRSQALTLDERLCVAGAEFFPSEPDALPVNPGLTKH